MDSRPTVRLHNIHKAFGATRALKGVDFEVMPGEVHAIIGENGAGKSTLMKILSGAHVPDGGKMELAGAPYAPANPLSAQEKGVAMVYQELNLAPQLSVRENLLLGMESSRLGFVRNGHERERARAALDRLGHASIDLEIPVHRLSIAEQQVVEIARACLRDVRLLILDEPTSSLGRADVKRLFTFIRELRDAGVSILYISHFLEECQEVADRYTVLRDGESVESGLMREVSIDDLIRLMVGRNLGEMYPRVDKPLGGVLLRIEGLSGKKNPQEVNLDLRSGEILGVAGLIGAGRTELLRSLFGLDPRVAGRVELEGVEVPARRPRKALAAGLGLLSENRKEEGLLLNQTLTDNILAIRFPRYSRGGLLSVSRMRQRTQEWIDLLQIRTSGPDCPVERLSGGNQQKVAIARLLEHDARVLLLDEPTRGVDVQSKAQIYQLVSDLASRGKAILIVSSYLPELLGLCDRIAVMSRGRCVAVREREAWTEESLLAAAIGGAQT